ncbi:DUF4382 domain-containing protein [Niabella sp. CC-SYL272]|uniref:DUF4382 domain-containing protein n=1 Tax=Niabella agricola TaxID=2891571 RepID=UPI001F480374|nr:DUF4382 domain-containing protein [Niabella agricola]MCF3112043.1 DUF4382 domain-containing protein [Niabella agricola]
MKSLFLAMGAAGLLMFASCSKNDSNSNAPENGNSKVQFVLTDAPALYDAVNINIKEVKINMGGEGTDSNWVSYPLSPDLAKPVNLLDLRNGDYMYMGEPLSLPAGTISQIRLVLGDGNTVVVNGQSYNLSTPSAQQSGLKIKFNQTLEPNGIYKIWLDFDAARSVVKAGNSGIFNLKPVLYAKMEAATFGAIKGTVLPSVAGTTVYLLKGADTVGSAIPEKAGSTYGEGYYKFINLGTGTYSLSFNAVDSTNYKDSTVANIMVDAGKTTDVPKVTLHQ